MENVKTYRLSDRFLKDEEFSGQKNVIKAYDTATCERALLKRWRNSDGGGINEIKVRSSVSHPNITEFLCSFEENEYRYMACRWADGISLNEYVYENGPLEERDALLIFSEICSTVEYLNNAENGPLVHGDIKPENVIVNMSGGESHGKIKVFLIDFETCTRIPDSGDKSHENQETLPWGSYFFSAPETLWGRKTANSDMYSAGAVLGFMLFGKDFYENTELCLKTEMKSGRILRACMIREEKQRKITAGAAVSGVKALLNNEKADKVELFLQNQETQQDTKSGETEDNPPLRVAGKLSVCVDSNLCFATELAYACGNLFKMKTILVDSYPSKNRVSSYMLGEMVSEEESGFYGISGFTGNLKNKPETWYERGLIGISAENKYLYIATQTLCEELFSEETNLEDFYGWAYKNFDAVVINVYKNTEESIKNELFRLSNSVIIAEEPNIDNVESLFGRYACSNSGGVNYGNNLKYVAWNYHKDRSLPREGIRCLVGNENYLGSVSFDETRYRMMNMSDKREFFGKSRETKKEYGEILSKLLFGGET